MRYGSLVVGAIMLVFGGYLFFDGRGTFDYVNSCLQSAGCTIYNGLANNGAALQSLADQGQFEMVLGLIVGVIGLILVGVGFTGRKQPESVTYVVQQPVQNYPSTAQPASQHQTPPTNPAAASGLPAQEPPSRIFCPRCGAPSSATKNYCRKCGASLR